MVGAPHASRGWKTLGDGGNAANESLVASRCAAAAAAAAHASVCVCVCVVCVVCVFVCVVVLVLVCVAVVVVVLVVVVVGGLCACHARAARRTLQVCLRVVELVRAFVVRLPGKRWQAAFRAAPGAAPRDDTHPTAAHLLSGARSLAATSCVHSSCHAALCCAW